MSTAAKNKKEQKSILLENFKPAKIDPNMKDLSNYPYFVQKRESAKRLIEKYGTPGNPPKSPNK